ncbi:MAG: pyruvate carboxylase subunit B [Fibrobacteria bacterium]|nr:pyruvate carboxylase subunit B [Fibrobacteria bacterium]
MSQSAVKFNQTVLRDGHQSLAATRMKTSQMLPVVETLDGMGFNALETWGGATIDSCLRYLAENPFDRLRALKKLSPKTPHQMLLRGQNIVQYQAFPDDVVRAFVKCSMDAGMTNLRIFDALNDIRNLRTAIAATLEFGGHAQGAISYTVSPVHTIEAFVQMAVEFEGMGCQSVCIKDMAGLLLPRVAYDLVKAIKAKVKLPVSIHSHNTAGLANTAYYAAVEAGADLLDCSIAPFANGTGQPDTVLMEEILTGTGRAPTYDRDTLFDLQKYFEGVYKELGAYTSPDNERTDVGILRYQVPGGMMSNFLNQLKEQGMGDKVAEVMAEIPYVRQCLGWIPLVTPTSQIVGTQAMINVKMGRWKMIPQNTKDIVLGKYGKTPGPIDADVLKLVVDQTGEKPIEGRGADLLAPRMETLRQELTGKGLASDDEACVLYAMFPQQTEAVLNGTAKPEVKVAAPKVSDSSEISRARRVALTVDGIRKDVLVEEYK